MRCAAALSLGSLGASAGALVGVQPADWWLGWLLKALRGEGITCWLLRGTQRCAQGGVPLGVLFRAF